MMLKKIIRIILAIAPVLAVILVVGEFIATNELAGLGQRVQEMESQIDKIREQNEVLRQEVASASAFATIAQKAQALGLSQQPRYIVIGREEFALHEPLK